LRTRWNHLAYAVDIDGIGAFGQHPVHAATLMAPFDAALALVRNGFEGGMDVDYVDSHAWAFTPAGLSLIMLELAELGLVNWHIDTLSEPIGCEFHVTLRRGRVVCADPAERDARRLALLRRQLVEMREKLDFAVAGGLVPRRAGKPAAAAPAVDLRRLLDDALQRHRTGDLDGAARAYREVLDTDPHSGEALHLLGLVAHSQGRLAEAVALIESAIAQEASARFLANLAMVLNDLKRLPEAEAACRWALEQVPDYPEALNTLGVVLAAMERPEEAVLAFRRAVALRADYAEAHLNLAGALAAQQCLPDAEAAFRTAFRLRPALGLARDRAADGRRRVLFVSAVEQLPGHVYRCLRMAEAARDCGWDAACIALPEADAAKRVGWDVVILWRIEFSARVCRLIAIARASGARIGLDIDDLVIAPELARIELIDGIRSSMLDEARTREHFNRIRRTLLAADFASCSTEELAVHLRLAGRPAWVVANGFDTATWTASRLAAQQRRQAAGDGLLRIGYAGGTRTHQKDFRAAAPALARVLAREPRARLVLFRDPADGKGLVLHTEIPELMPVAGQIEWRDLVPLDRLPLEMARFDINIAPLEAGNLFAGAKSELKYFEAALVEVPTIASPTGPFRRAIAHGTTGFLAGDDAAWEEMLWALLRDTALRHRVGAAAYRDAVGRFGPQQRSLAVEAMLTALYDGPAAPAPAAAPGPAPAVTGFVEELSVLQVCGYAHPMRNTNERVDCVAVVARSGRVVGRCAADHFRVGLAGISGGDGRHGFTIRFDSALDAADLEDLQVLCGPQNDVLPRAPALLRDSAPIDVLAMDIVDNCNLRCPFCVYDYAQTRATHFMTEETLEAALQFLPYTLDSNFWFSCLHEPTLHPKLMAFIDRVPWDFRRKIFYTTNLAKRMPPVYFDWLGDAGLHHINISVESLQPALYERMRKGARHRIFQENWDRLIPALRAGRRPTRLRYIAMAYKSNLRELPGMVRYLLQEREAWQVELRYTFDVPHMPPMFREREYLEPMEWAWLYHQLADLPKDRVILSLPPGFVLPAGSAGFDLPPAMVAVPDMPDHHTEAPEPMDPPEAGPVASTLLGKPMHVTAARLSPQGETKFRRGRYQLQLGADGKLNVFRAAHEGADDIAAEQHLMMTHIRNITDPAAFLRMLPV
jgi:tetratricopeptide (TPR) repeat protein